ncbi:hypothetical protein ACHHYP_15761 [Achlya hypogyna]|uniref:Chromatin modification-related protein MEAF6 n=1 Tax=Achlya hypogyna TaxID=1202772 RepID=A0A1V9YA61_ACHHY|nr:hypothetical protein ACHHYP_15761 [Achlya hypogyna]
MPTTAGEAPRPSEGIKVLEDAQRKLDEALAKLEAQIEESESSYLEDTAHGNIIRGWDGYADLKGKKDILLKKVRPYTYHEKVFTSSSIPPLVKAVPVVVAETTTPAADEKKKPESKATLKAGTSASKHLKLKVKKRKHKDTIGSEEDEAS